MSVAEAAAAFAEWKAQGCPKALRCADGDVVGIGRMVYTDPEGAGVLSVPLFTKGPAGYASLDAYAAVLRCEG